mgnify:CR=1 FL=1
MTDDNSEDFLLDLADATRMEDGDGLLLESGEIIIVRAADEEVLDIIMDSNESKLGADGKPIYDANGKFLKGPNYWKPEPKIKSMLEGRGIQTQA